jgi:hypothetical protein
MGGGQQVGLALELEQENDPDPTYRGHVASLDGEGNGTIRPDNGAEQRIFSKKDVLGDTSKLAVGAGVQYAEYQDGGKLLALKNERGLRVSGIKVSRNRAVLLTGACCRISSKNIRSGHLVSRAALVL